MSEATRVHWWHYYATVALVAFSLRLMVALRGGALYGIGQYDAAVYFGSAVGLSHGRVPYRDFLLLHPPGIVVILLPFAGLAQWIGDDHAMVVARLAFMGLGAITAALVVRLLRSVGLAPAVLGGLAYAVSYPAVSIEQTTRLEAVGAICLVGALVLLGVAAPRATLTHRDVLLAGALVGLASTIKIWGVVSLVVVFLWLVVVAGGAHAARFALGSVVMGVLVCGPFLVAAPEQMWRYVILDQLGRGSAATALDRLVDITGLGLVERRLGGWAVPLVALAVALWLLAAVLALGVAQARLAVALLAVLVLLLMTTPSWFPHYAGLVAGVGAIVFGAGVGQLGRLRPERFWQAAATVAAGVVLVGSVAQLSAARFGKPFPADSLQPVLRSVPGCVTADDPSVLIALDVLSRNLGRGCPLVIDPGGYSHHFKPQIPRARDKRWQRFFMEYLGSGTVAIKVRYDKSFGLSAATARDYRQWPVLHSAGKYELRKPLR